MDRWMTLGIIAVIILAFIMIAFALPAHGSLANDGYGTAIITVHYGDTLTGYARKYAPGMKVRDYIDEVKRINHMDTGMIYAGDDIVILKEVEE